jgi:hypothetical protein
MRRFLRKFVPGENIRRTILFLLLLCLPVVSGAAFLPESAEARRRMMDRMTAPLRPYQEIERETIQQRSGGQIFYRTYEQRGNRYYSFKHMDDEGDWNLVAPGTWVVQRRIEDGEFNQIKIFLQNDEESFLRVIPDGRRARMEVHIAGDTLYTGVPVPMALQRILTAPFAMLQESTSGFVDWDLLVPDPYHPGYRRIERMVEAIRAYLPSLRDADDGAADENGNLVYIETLLPQENSGGFNCSGFAKWVIDGLWYPGRGSYLPVEPLKRKHLEYRGTSWSASLEESRDPYFGLDWTRNLALHLYAAEQGVTPESLDPRSTDVRGISSASFTENVGFPVEEVRHVLYRQALRDPGFFYLGSVNVSYGEDIVLRQHTHVVVFFPWFDQEGRFRLAVMERNRETGMESLKLRYRGDFIHLVRVSAGMTFETPRVFDGVADDD